MGPVALEELITAFARLPGIGRKTAQRLAFYVIKSPREEAQALAQALLRAKDDLLPCARCFNFTERGQELCEVCRNPRRDRQLICVVEEASDVLVLERNQLMSGVYHVLGGVLSPLDGIGPEDLRIRELIARVKQEGVREIILAHNASAEGDATAEYLSRQLAPLTRVTRLARGLPVGADLDLADKVTLAHALEGRHSF
ncbi:MAG: recombination protein RecR [Candidatus Latescibacteria bacterium]|nr:recombination protein RecR [Candidatus Latescibacterota bacterium]